MSVSELLALGTLSIHVLLAVVFVYFSFIGPLKREYLVRYLATHAIKISFIVALIATLGSLMYSNLLGFTPCPLCWWQRIFLFPLTLVLGVSLLRQEKTIVPYGLALSIPGLTIALYHYYLEWGGSALVPCSAAADCARRYVFEFGYISIPLMAATAFTVITAVLVVGHLRKQ